MNNKIKLLSCVAAFGVSLGANAADFSYTSLGLGYSHYKDDASTANSDAYSVDGSFAINKHAYITAAAKVDPCVKTIIPRV
jgi:hypothetical protein